MNEQACINAMAWFRDEVYFSRTYSDFPDYLLEYSDDSNMLTAIADYAKAADVGIQDMQFEFATRILPIHKIFPQKFLKKFVQHLHSFYKHFLTPRPSRSTNFAWAKCGQLLFIAV